MLNDSKITMEKELITSYKGFNNDLRCRGFQYEVGKEYSFDGKIEIGVRGFHACENPLNVIDFYDNMTNNRYCVVEQYGDIQKEYGGVDLIVSSKIRIKEEISIDELFKRGLEYLKKKTIVTNELNFENKNINNESLVSNLCDGTIVSGGDFVKIASNGDSSSIFSKGDSVQIASNGEGDQIAANGNYPMIGASGSFTNIGSTNKHAKISASGELTKITASGQCSNISASGNYVQVGVDGIYNNIALSGSSSKIASSGEDNIITTSGSSSKISSSGKYSNIATGGFDTQINSTGDYAKISASGRQTKIDSNGNESVIACVGEDSMVKAKVGSWIILSEWKISDENDRYVPICVKSEYVDGERIKGDTWYELKDGEFVEVLS